MPESMRPSPHTAKLLTAIIGIVTTLGGIWARFVAVEQRQEGITASVVEERGRVDRISERVDSLERDRQMLERVHTLELKLSSLESQIDSVIVTKKKQR